MSIRDYLTKRLTQGNNNDPHTKGSNTKKMNKVLDDKGMSIESIPTGGGVNMPMVDSPLVDKKPSCCCAKGDGSNVVKKFITMKYVEPKLFDKTKKPETKSVLKEKY